jgi:hypothetical protein
MVKTYACNRLDPETGEPCRLVTKRKSNLERHVERIHKEKKSKFVHYVVDSQGDLQKGAEIPHTSLESLTTEPTPPPSTTANASQSNIAIPVTHFSHTNTAIGLQASQIVNGAGNPIASTHANSEYSSSNAINETAPTDENTARVTQNTPIALWTQRKDTKRRHLCEALEKDDHPVYQVKRSKKWSLQQIAIEWITRRGKAHFNRYLAILLGQWGVKETHKGTCVLLPADWAALDPLRLASMFDADNCPRAWADVVVCLPPSLEALSNVWQTYQYADHCTNLTRSIAWFDDKHWPRTGLELDNFLGSSPYKPKEGSHLCHKHLCSTHLVFESAEANEDRKQCHQRSDFLRKENLPVPQHCDRHDLPCLMQHAALTTLEAFLIQFHVLLMAKGKAPLEPPPRPQWHPYLTFEYQLPLTFCQANPAVDVDSGEIVSGVVNTKGKPELRCLFCSRIKAFKSIIALWSHFVHQHSKSTEHKHGHRLWKW